METPPSTKQNQIVEPKPAPTGWAFAALLAVVAFVVYFPALHGPFIYDDFHHITRPELRSFAGLWRIWTDPWATAQYYPVTHSLFWLQQRIWGDAVVWYHVINILLHVSAASLLALLLGRLLIPGARLAAFLFLLHPVAVESVAWISEQKNTLSTVFFLGAALVYLDFHDRRRWQSYALASLLFVSALLSKSVTATLPAALLVVLWWRHGRLQWRRDILPLAPWLAAGAASGLFTAWLEKHSIGAQGPTFALGAMERVILAGRTFWFYLCNAIWPTGLVFNYPRWTIEAGQMSQYTSSLAALALAAAAAWIARKHRGPLVWLLLFGGLLFPVLGFFNIYPFRFSYVADHFMYLALLPLAAGAARTMHAATSQLPATAKKTSFALVILLLVLLGTGSFRHSRVFSGEERFYREILAQNPKSALAHYNLGVVLAKRPGAETAALEEYRAAIASDPTYAEAYNNLGMLLETQPGGEPEAEASYRTALSIMPDLVEANYNLALTLLRSGRQPDEALRLLEKSVSLRPQFPAAHYQLGGLYERDGRKGKAEESYRRALRLRPDYADAHYSLGLLLAENPSRFSEAESELAEAVRLNPRFPEAHYSLGAVRARIPGKQDAAMNSYREALQLAPDFAEAHNNLGRLLAQKEATLPEAIAHFEAALRINPGSAEARRNLEAARRTLAGTK